jgi:hypothetical protein
MFHRVRRWGGMLWWVVGGGGRLNYYGTICWAQENNPTKLIILLET